MRFFCSFDVLKIDVNNWIEVVVDCLDPPPGALFVLCSICSVGVKLYSESKISLKGFR